MGGRLTTVSVALSLLVFTAMMLVGLVYLWRRRKRLEARPKENAEQQKERRFVRYRPSPLNLDKLRAVSQQPQQLTPRPLVITPTSPNQFVIPSISRSTKEDDACYPTELQSPATPPSRKLMHKQLSASRSTAKFHRTLSEGSGLTRELATQETRTPHGKIKLYLKLDNQENRLSVQILGKKGHSLHWFTGISNPYVRISLISNAPCEEDNGVLSTQILDLGVNQQCELDGITSDNITDCFLKFVILDYDRFSRNEFVAEVMVVLGDLEHLGDGVTVCEDLLLQQKVMLSPRGSFLISLCNQSVAQQLQVTIMKADGVWSKGKELHVTTKLETATICYKRKSKGLRKNTSYIFNEKLVFDVATGELANANLVLDVRKSDSKLLHETKLGYVKLGLNSDMALEIRHWSEMLASPQKQIAEWHQLHHR